MKQQGCAQACEQRTRRSGDGGAAGAAACGWGHRHRVSCRALTSLQMHGVTQWSGHGRVHRALNTAEAMRLDMKASVGARR